MEASTLKSKGTGMEYSMHSVVHGAAAFNGKVRFDQLSAARIENRFPGVFVEVKEAVAHLADDATSGGDYPVDSFLVTASGTGRAGQYERFEFVAIYFAVKILADGTAYVTLRA
jgi:hypothetical protein